MIQITPQHQIFICTKPIDFRKGLDGMATVCKQVLQADPFCGAIFAFTNRSRIFVRLLIYDGNGFWLCHKRFSAANSSGGRQRKRKQTQSTAPNYKLFCNKAIQVELNLGGLGEQWILKNSPFNFAFHVKPG